MNLVEARIALRHRKLLDVLDLALRFVVAHIAPYAALTAFVLVPCFVLNLIVLMEGGAGWGWLVAIALASFAQVPFTVLGSRLVFEHDVRLDDVLLTALRALPRMIGARILQVLGIIAGTSFFFLPGIWVATTLLFVTEVIVLERSSVGNALSRCQRLNAGEFGEALQTLILLVGLELVAVFLGDSALRTFLEELLQISAPPGVTDSEGGVLGLVSFWLFVPYATTARLLAYLNVRTKAEGWDVQTRFAAIAVRLAGESEPQKEAA
jgi:hypothetical protein